MRVEFKQKFICTCWALKKVDVNLLIFGKSYTFSVRIRHNALDMFKHLLLSNLVP